MSPRSPRRLLRLEALEARLAPVVGANANAPLVARGQGYDGVVRLEHVDSDNGSFICTGSLLFTGRHILTAAHCLTDDGQFASSQKTHVNFELLDGKTPRNIVVDVPSDFYRVNPDYNGDESAGNDVAFLILPDQVDPTGDRQMIAPFGAERDNLYTGPGEIGQVFTTVGYGRAGTGITGSLEGTSGTKRIGQNRFEAYASKLSEAPFDSPAPKGQTALAWDFDNGQANNDAFGFFYGIHDLGLGAGEANPAQGDSGGPLFIGNQIAGLVSYSDGGKTPPDINTDIDRGFGEFGVGTRVSAFQSYIAGITGRPYGLVLDMDYQLAGVNGRVENLTITARRNGANIELVVAGAANPALDGVYYSAPAADIRSLTIRGSADNETFRIEGDLGVGPVTIEGRGGNDAVVLDFGTSNPLARGLTFRGGAGRDTVVAAVDTSFRLDGARIDVAGFGSVALAGVESARLTGGPSDNRFTAGGWRGQALLDGAGGRDTLDVVSPGGSLVATNQPAGPAQGIVTISFPDGVRGYAEYLRVEAVTIPGNALSRFVQGLYQRVLHRPASPAEIALQGQNLLRGGSAAVAGLLHSPEARRVLVRGWFRLYLGREARPGEEQPWVAELLSGQSEEKSLASLLASARFVPAGSSGDVAFLARLFAVLIARPATGAETAVWARTLRYFGREATAWMLLTGREYRTRFVNDLYRTILGRQLPPGLLFAATLPRPPTPQEVNGWVVSGLDLDGLRLAFLASADLFRRPA